MWKVFPTKLSLSSISKQNQSLSACLNLSVFCELNAAAIFALQRQKAIAGALAFWMANSSELLNFLKHDKNLSPLTQQSQQDLSHLVHSAYRYRP